MQPPKDPATAAACRKGEVPLVPLWQSPAEAGTTAPAGATSFAGDKGCQVVGQRDLHSAVARLRAHNQLRVRAHLRRAE